VGIFETRAQAVVAVDHLWHAGFAQEDVGLAAPGEPVRVAHTPTGEAELIAARGAVGWAVAGGAVGAVAGALVAGLIPGIGPVIAGGLLGSVVTGAAAGAAAGTFAGPFLALGFSDTDARKMAGGVRAGHTVVVVRTDDRIAEAERILRECAAFDVTPCL
jgi:hypothetical protein